MALSAFLPLQAPAKNHHSAELKRIYDQDQTDRMALDGTNDAEQWIKIRANDKTHYQRILELLKQDQLRTGKDYYYAAMIMQHGHSAEDYMLAHILAMAAAQKGVKDARWLSAASFDRLMISANLPQVFATQYYSQNQGPYSVQQPLKAALIPDSMRKTFNVPTLKENEKRLEEMNNVENKTINTSKTPDGFSGNWQGDLELGNGLKMPIVFHFSQTADSYTGTLDSPTQNATGITIDTITISPDGKLKATMSKLQAELEVSANIANKTLSGTFTQRNFPMQIELHAVDAYIAPNRPQEPKPPFSYEMEEVSFSSGSHTISGTLTRPKGDKPLPCVVLLHGSGPHDRDESIFGHKPFLLLADYLTKRGFAVLRYDKQGCHKSTGNYKTCTSKDFADDGVAAVKYLCTRQDIDASRIGLIGHSEGGVLAPIVANELPSNVKFIVLLAGNALSGEEVLLGQVGALSGDKTAETAKQIELARRSYEIVKAEPDNEKAIKKIMEMRESLKADDAKDPLGAAKLKAGLEALTSPWYRYFISYDPSTELSKTNCAVLALVGDRDIQVRADENLAVIERCLKAAGNQHFKTQKLPGLNHLMQTCTTGMPDEYSKIEETITPQVLQIVGDWLLEQTAR